MTENPFAPRTGLMVWMGNEIVPVDQAKISVFDHGILYGDGVFEGIRIYNGKIFKEAEHIKRFWESCKAIRLNIPMSSDDLSRAMHDTMRANGMTGDGYIRLIITRGVGALGISIRRTANPTVIIIVDKIALYPPEVYERGLHCMIASVSRNHPNTMNPRIKSLNYLNNVLAKAEAHEYGADEAIMLGVDGHVCECTGDNIFIVRNGELCTPGTWEGILEGITRGVVMELATKHDIPVRETSLVKHDLFIAEEVFVTGTAAEIVPITEINKTPVGDGKPGRITKMLMEDFVAYRNAQ
ncbi:MAG: branched-chain-amino-acid transaminase [Planctomycetes bacterium]|nr:branched-chain-amino-acid transaminase [Planctomycetota bacterium]MBI3833588.1 branched-chain-amino-acid transaminase [Planctomycetota bacterium]